MKRIDHSRNGFTLIEMLVVLAIIIIFLSLLVPAVNTGITRARSIRCMNNLRTIGQGLSLYATDHGGQLVKGAAFFGNEYWFHQLEPYLGFIEEDTQSVQRPAWQICPAKQVPILTNHTVGYGWNFYYLGYSPRPEHAGPDANRNWGWGTRLSEVPAPSETIVVGDSVDEAPEGQSYLNLYLYPHGGWTVARRHRGGGNYLFVDFSVRWLKAETLQAQLPYLYEKYKESH